MRWTKKKTKRQTEKAGERLAAGIASRILFFQRRLTDTLTTKCRLLSKTQQQLALVVFCLLFGGFSIHAFMQVFKPTVNFSRSLRPTAISIPPATLETGAEQKRAMVTADDVAKIHRFHLYMDSLSRSPTGRSVYDSIINARPQLMDSVRLIEQLFSSSSK